MSKLVVEILDIHGNILDSGIQYKLPEQRVLCEVPTMMEL